ncbi:homoserine O-acetyltransferase MetX [Marinithermus hydrothermalis]|uniref:Homoserine O-acetyltransferase n=1 Tax=Marinithermus hydrothermalis (strain DSM 14884 / JCM 11576 / T1) TaxID=869210 RepID=F2NLB2_MARHT|nr:homoserine O-acetyltransferase [Marinithermus hydrothermalis]AEB11731.1 Homoserine O-acetyltransferase [Marinithermus hydrothermalis DSM 14884]
MTGTVVCEAWGEHEALLLHPVTDASDAATVRPRTAVLWPRTAPFVTEEGRLIPEVRVRFETYGRLSAQRDNAVLVFHALTGSAHLAGTYDAATLARLTPLERAFGPKGWWDALVGAGRPLDPERYFVVCANILGSCYGTTGPTSRNPTTGRRYGPEFPPITIRDMVRVQARLLDHLGVERALVIGGSMGGMQALEFALMYPERTAGLVVIAATERYGPWARAFNRVAREAILNDPAFRNGRYEAQPPGLAVARAVAMMSYRAPRSFEARWGADPSQSERYIAYQAQRFLRRFDANTYLTLSHAMTTHDVTRGRGALPEVLERLAMPRLFVGIDSDLLYPAPAVRALAQAARGEYAELVSPHGHDAFLIEHDQVAAVLKAFGV